ncbi:lasso peptide biosynthesis PqqD family chaperone [Actinomadura sp. WMMB 499]|uniref:lasso peptide biosynthesis PqqD family chaperone n=1 Tax=Actinomadura sp. WMMB 499 TaxID=1219491 RepID=UPI0012466086|nr:lasso peptide biosynthesis PqqD family chaperone [Actinomadura sp. WMMB 499]QFG20277.1 lasso peptide biosynthesis PqqD family chaperone [Actinomadura sp. WMMB 499]
MRLSPDVTVTESGRDLVLLNAKTGRYWTLNQTGGAVLHLLMDGRSPADAAEELTRRHPAFADRIGRDVDAVVRSLLDEKVMLP